MPVGYFDVMSFNPVGWVPGQQLSGLGTSAGYANYSGLTPSSIVGGNQRQPHEPGTPWTVRRSDGSFVEVPWDEQGLFVGLTPKGGGPTLAAGYGTPEAADYRSDARRKGRQGAIKVAALVAGGAAIGNAMGAGAGAAGGGTGTATVSGTNSAFGSAAGGSSGASLGAIEGWSAAPAAGGGSGGGGFFSQLFGGGGGSGSGGLSSLFGGAQGGSMSWIPLAMQGAQTLLGARGARRARQEREAGIAEARGVQEGALEQTMGLFQNERDAGSAALRRMLGMAGLEGGDTGFDITQDPSYQFRMNESMRALESGASARGGLMSGGFARQALQLAGNFASQEYANIYNRLSGMVNLGMGAAGQQANALSGYSSNISNLITGRGEARAVGSAEKYNQLMDLAGAAGDWFGGRGGGAIGGTKYDIFED